MKLIATSQRVEVVSGYGERRDALDQQWVRFLERCGLAALPMPNHPGVAAELFANASCQGLVLTGGNTLAAYGGDAPERDRTEETLLAAAVTRNLPVLGICRGMQVIQHWCGVPLVRVTGHVRVEHAVSFEDGEDRVNSFHDFGATESVDDLRVTGRSADGVVEAVRHGRHRVMGMMWHPERYPEFRAADLAAVRGWFQ